jgi:hypothetical protein
MQLDPLNGDAVLDIGMQVDWVFVG